MADDWEDWDNDDYVPPSLKAATPANGGFETRGQAVLAAVAEPDSSKFAGEDEEEDGPTWESHVPKPQPPKEGRKPKYEGGDVEDDVPLDDPVEEKLRRQRLEEEADYRSTQELFGGATEKSKLDGFIPKSAKDFEKFAEMIAQTYIFTHKRNQHYKYFAKQLAKQIAQPLDIPGTKDVETSLAGVRADKLKQQKAEEAEKNRKKKGINVGKNGGSAGLDDYIYGDALDVDDEFM